MDIKDIEILKEQRDSVLKQYINLVHSEDSSDVDTLNELLKTILLHSDVISKLEHEIEIKDVTSLMATLTNICNNVDFSKFDINNLLNIVKQ